VGVVAPLAGVVVAAALLLAARGLDEVAAPGQLGPGFWPRLTLVGLGLACLAHALVAWRRRERGAPVAAAAPVSTPRLAGGIALVLAYVLATPPLGWALATPLFMVAFMRLGGARRWPALGVTAAVGTVALLYLFVKAVYLPLPKGDAPFEAVTIALYRALGIF
jgi:hypothetical protein